MNSISNNIIRQILLLATVIIIGVILFYELKTFIPAFLGAYTLYVLLRGYMMKLINRGWKKQLAVIFLMFTSFLVILLPIFLVANMLTGKLSFAISHSTEIFATIESYLRSLETRYNFSILNGDTFKKLTDLGTQNITKILGATFNTLTTLVMMYFILYFMLMESMAMEMRLRYWMPLKRENIEWIGKELNMLVYSNAIGIPLIALAQGLVALVGYLILGVSEPMFWFAITCVAAMLPIVGAAIVYVPLGLVFFANNLPGKGIIMLLYGFLIIGTVDNVFRFWLQKKIGDVHPLITVFGVIIGINMFGFVGLIFGPILISIFVLLTKVYANEFEINRRTRVKKSEEE
ncbi:AI-2E family transporter [Gynurincola endophyticus]|uniref:AI-2E family transporter n=1 Tax=Gynurincola endophyticus TaxID=2479004 RepID=UPI000F8CF70C|nr:AI-2E family transporter [Gynurincola endophyticus]